MTIRCGMCGDTKLQNSVPCPQCQPTKTETWPDLTIDQQAWQVACNELPGAPLSTVLERAQEIKEIITAYKKIRPRSYSLEELLERFKVTNNL